MSRSLKLNWIASSFISLNHTGDNAQHPKQKRDTGDNQRSGAFAGASESWVHLNHLLRLECLAYSDWLQNDSEAENAEDGVFQRFISLLARDGGFFGDRRRASAQRHGLARATVFLALDFNQTIRTKRFRTTGTTVHRGHVGMIFALHKASD